MCLGAGHCKLDNQIGPHPWESPIGSLPTPLLDTCSLVSRCVTLRSLPFCISMLSIDTIFVQVLFRQPFLDNTAPQQTPWSSVTECLIDITNEQIDFGSLYQTSQAMVVGTTCSGWRQHMTEVLLHSKQKTEKQEREQQPPLTYFLPLGPPPKSSGSTKRVPPARECFQTWACGRHILITGCLLSNEQRTSGPLLKA